MRDSIRWASDTQGLLESACVSSLPTTPRARCDDGVASRSRSARMSDCEFPNLAKTVLIAFGVFSGASGMAQTQDVVSTPSALSIRSGDVMELDVLYESSNGASGLLGLGIRLHWNSSDIAFVALTDVLVTGKLGEDAVCQDDSLFDFDGDPATDCYVQVAWTDIDAGWPGSSSVKLFSASLTSYLPDGATATVGFTASSTSPGYGLNASGTVISGLPGISVGTLRVHLSGYGSVSSLPEGIDCTAPCSDALGACGVCVDEFTIGETVLLLADTAARGVRPPIWDGCTPDDAGYSCMVDITGDEDVSVGLEFCWECLPNATGWRSLLAP